MKSEHVILVKITKSLVKLINILLTLKKNNENNVMTIKLVYNVRYAYKRSKEDLKVKCNN